MPVAETVAPVEIPEIDHPEFEPVYTKPDDSGEFVMVILEEDTPTIDGRRFAPGSVSWRDLPIPLMFKTTNDGPGAGHKGARVGGAITDVWKDGTLVYGAGHFASNEDGQELRQLIAEGALTGVSADVGGATVELEADSESGKETRTITEGKIMMVTCLPGQAFDDSRISVTADGGPVSPPFEWFSNPQLNEPTALTVTEDGRIYGHAFTWGSCHVGMRDRCLNPPHSKSGYRYFAVGQTMTFASEFAPQEFVNTGVLTLDTDHAGITLNAEQSKKHYDHTGVQVADISMGEDAIGGWFAGALRPNLTQDQIRTIRASAVSGDWRTIGGSLELVGLLVVNTPGFPVPRANVKDHKALALVASGVVTPCGCEDCTESAAGPDRFLALDFAMLDSIMSFALTAKARKKLPKSAFAGPNRSYPVPDASHAANAKARATQAVNAGRMSKAQRAKIVAKANKVLSASAEVTEEFVNHNHTPGRGHAGTNVSAGPLASGPLGKTAHKYVKLRSPTQGSYIKSTGKFAPKKGGGPPGTMSQHDTHGERKQLAQRLARPDAKLNELINKRKLNKSIKASDAARRGEPTLKSQNVPKPVNPRERTRYGSMTVTRVSEAQRQANRVAYNKEHPETKGQRAVGHNPFDRGVSDANMTGAELNKAMSKSAPKRSGYAANGTEEFVNHNHTPGRGHSGVNVNAGPLGKPSAMVRSTAKYIVDYNKASKLAKQRLKDAYHNRVAGERKAAGLTSTPVHRTNTGAVSKAALAKSGGLSKANQLGIAKMNHRAKKAIAKMKATGRSPREERMLQMRNAAYKQAIVDRRNQKTAKPHIAEDAFNETIIQAREGDGNEPFRNLVHRAYQGDRFALNKLHPGK